MPYFAIVAKNVNDDATYYDYPEQKAARVRLADMDGLTFDTLEEAEEYLAGRGVKKEGTWAYPTERAHPNSSSIWFLRLDRPTFRIGGGFQLCQVNGSRRPAYSGTHPGNIAGVMREIADRVGGSDADALNTMAADVERLGKLAGVKFI